MLLPEVCCKKPGGFPPPGVIPAAAGAAGDGGDDIPSPGIPEAIIEDEDEDTRKRLANELLRFDQR